MAFIKCTQTCSLFSYNKIRAIKFSHRLENLNLTLLFYSCVFTDFLSHSYMHRPCYFHDKSFVILCTRELLLQPWWKSTVHKSLLSLKASISIWTGISWSFNKFFRRVQSSTERTFIFLCLSMTTHIYFLSVFSTVKWSTHKTMNIQWIWN